MLSKIVRQDNKTELITASTIYKIYYSYICYHLTLWHFLCFYYFFFLSHSNTGADQITKTAVDFWKNGKDREEMMLKDFESFLSPIVFNSDQSECLYHSPLTIIHHLRWSSFLLKISLFRQFFKVNFYIQLSGWCFHPIPASGVQTCCTVCDGCDERRRSSARWGCGRPGGQRFSLLPQTGESICREWLQDSSK